MDALRVSTGSDTGRMIALETNTDMFKIKYRTRPRNLTAKLLHSTMSI